MTALTGTQRPRTVPRESPVLVGRGPELGWLNEAFARVRGGSPAALLIGGDAGVGKSRLVSAFGKKIPARVLTGRCRELGPVGLPYGPFVTVLREVTGGREFAGPGVSPGRELLRWLPGPGRPAAGSPAPRQARARLFVEMLALLEQLARQRPVMLVIEDAHWADESTRELLSFLIDSQQAMDRVLIAVTYRSDDLHRCHPLRALLPRLGRIGWVQRTELTGLRRHESAELVARLTGGEPAPSRADRVYRRAGGNPLFTEEMVSCDGERGACTATPRDLMLAAVRRLPEETQEVLRTASVGGQRTGRGLLAAVTGMGAGELDGALGPAVASGVLTADEGSCVFRHSLIGEALHDDLLPGEHTATHQRFAAALQEDPALAPAGSAAFEQAEHWHHAHDPARTLRSAWRAAAEAGGVLACAEQLAMLTRVLELWPCVPDAERLTATTQAQVLRQAADAASATGERQLGSSLAVSARAAEGMC